MKTSYYLISILLIILPLNYVYSQEIVAKLSGNTSGEGFSVKDNLNNTLFRITGEGNVGIGTTNPFRKMQVNGALGWGATNAVLQTDQGASIELRGDGSPYIDFSNDSVSDYNVRLVLNRNNILEIDGDVGIGTSNANGYKLAVGGNVIAEEIVVKLKENWPDYVFNKNYEKLEIKELERYILDNGHLPKIPNAENVSKEGMNIGEIQIKLLEKIEELTLYLIEQNKKLEKLENEYELLKKKIDSN